jgi:hypothetical protein
MKAGWWIRAAVLAGCVAAAGGACSRAVTLPGIEAAREAFISHDVSRAEGLYTEVAGSDTASAVDRAAAFRRLAALAWRYRLEADSGRGLLERALEAGADSSSTFSELARLETAAGRTPAAMDAAESAIRTATTGEGRIRAVARLAEAAVDPVRAALLDEGRWPDDAARSRLRKALERLRPLNDSVPGLIETSLLQLEAALLLDDGGAALAGWRSYYVLHLERGGPLPAAHETLSRTFGEWSGPGTAASTREETIEALAASGRHDAALIVAADPRSPAGGTAGQASTADVIAYSLALYRVEALTDEYYRATAVGSGDPDAYRDALFAEGERLWLMLDWPAAMGRSSKSRRSSRRSAEGSARSCGSVRPRASTICTWATVSSMSHGRSSSTAIAPTCGSSHSMESCRTGFRRGPGTATRRMAAGPTRTPSFRCGRSTRRDR